MKDFKTAIILLCMAAAIAVNAQPAVNPMQVLAVNTRKMAHQMERAGDAYSALSFYSQYVSGKAQVTAEDHHKLAVLSERTRDYRKAADHFMAAYTADNSKYKEDLLAYAGMQKQLGEYQAALDVYEKIISETKTFHLDRMGIKNIRTQEEGCRLALQPYAGNENKISLLGFSSQNESSESSPLQMNDSVMIYCAITIDTVKSMTPGAKDELIPVKRFMQAVKVKGTWQPAGVLTASMNKAPEHEGNGAFSSDKMRFYFTRTCENPKHGWSTAIYMAAYVNGIWGEPVKLDELVNLGGYNATQPAVGPVKNGQELIYFVSDRPGGKGGNDIWFTVHDLARNNFSLPQNAGDKINTAGNEITPFYDAQDQTMYFSSDGLAGMGGYDVFRAIGRQRKWTAPVNLGASVNTNADELYYSVDHQTKQGFFVSNRSIHSTSMAPSCCDNLYTFSVSPVLSEIISGYVATAGQENGQSQELRGMKIKLMIQDATGDKITIDSTTSDEKGFFSFIAGIRENYVVSINQDGYLAYENSIHKDTINMLRTDTTWLNITMNTVSKESYTVKNIYFDFNKSELSAANKKTLDSMIVSMMQANPEVRVEIVANTDSKGDEAYNSYLSDQRAISVISYLVSCGIDSSRLKAVSLGDTNPIAPNVNSDLTDNPDGRALNRRVEFRIITGRKTMVSYTSMM